MNGHSSSRNFGVTAASTCHLPHTRSTQGRGFLRWARGADLQSGDVIALMRGSSDRQYGVRARRGGGLQPNTSNAWHTILIVTATTIAILGSADRRYLRLQAPVARVRRCKC